MTDKFEASVKPAIDTAKKFMRSVARDPRYTLEQKRHIFGVVEGLAASQRLIAAGELDKAKLDVN